MLTAIAGAQYRKGLRALERGDLDALLAQFADHCHLVFVGDTPLGADITDIAAARTWFERFRRLLPAPRFEIQRLVVSGVPWRLLLAAHVVIRSTIAGAPYENQFAHFLVLRWGKVVEDVILEDTQRWARACNELVAAGVAEANAQPMRDAVGV